MNGEIKLAKALTNLQAAITSKKYLQEAGQFVRSAAVMGAPADSGHLKQNIFLRVKDETDGAAAEVFTNVRYAGFVEFGTGPKGAANHAGISPEIEPSYSLSPWYIHESMIDPAIAERYHWQVFETKQGKFYRCYGQPARPFMYPALHEHEQDVINILKSGFEGAARKAKR